MWGGFLANLLFDCVFIPFVFFNVLLKPTFSVEAGVAIQRANESHWISCVSNHI